MNVSDDLFLLISSLSSYEKAYCMRHFRQMAGKKNTLYLDLFQAMYKQETYDEPALRKRFAKGRHASQFSVAKQYLYQQLSKALARYHAKSSRWSEYFEELRSIEMLYARRMYVQAEKRIVVLRKKADAEAKPMMRLLILDMLRQVREISRTRFGDQAVLEVDIVEEQEALDLLQERQRAWADFARVEHQLEVGGVQRAPEFIALLKALEAADALNEMAVSDWEARYFRLATRARRDHYFAEDYVAYADTTEKIIQHLETHADFGGMQWFRYFAALLLQVSTQISLRDYEPALRVIAKAYQAKANFPVIPDRSVRFLNKVFFTVEIRCYAGVGCFDEAMARLESLKISIRDSIDSFNVTAAVSFFPNVAWIYLGTGNFQEALFWITTTRNICPPDTLWDYYNKVLLIELVVLYELEKFELLESRLHAFRRYVSRRNAVNLYDGLVATFFHKMMRATTEAEKKTLLERFHAGMSELQSHPDPEANRSMDYFYMQYWVESKLTGSSFRATTQRHRTQPDAALLAKLMEQGCTEL